MHSVRSIPNAHQILYYPHNFAPPSCATLYHARPPVRHEADLCLIRDLQHLLQLPPHVCLQAQEQERKATAHEQEWGASLATCRQKGVLPIAARRLPITFPTARASSPRPLSAPPALPLGPKHPASGGAS